MRRHASANRWRYPLQTLWVDAPHPGACGSNFHRGRECSRGNSSGSLDEATTRVNAMRPFSNGSTWKGRVCAENLRYHLPEGPREGRQGGVAGSSSATKSIWSPVLQFASQPRSSANQRITRRSDWSVHVPWDPTRVPEEFDGAGVTGSSERLKSIWWWCEWVCWRRSISNQST